MIIEQIDNGKRLDVILAKHPDCATLGTRARKRLCDEGRVLVHGIARNAVYKVKTNQEITIISNDIDNSDIFNLEVLNENDNFIAFFKPKGIATEHVKGSSVPSIEEEIQKRYNGLTLLNRLDTETFGIVVAAKHENAKALWKEEQDKGKIQKKYYALVENVYPRQMSEMQISNEIDLSKTKVKAVEKRELDRTRYTKVQAVNEDKIVKLINKFLPNDLANISQQYTNLFNGKYGDIVDCTIYKGVRHQIRCHLAYVGLPLVGDSLYGSGLMEECFLLFHYKLESEIFCAECAMK